jgi:uncharacterized DUF497 family protein
MNQFGLFFEWDERKARSNFAKHRVTFENASTVFADPNSITIFDDSHSKNEPRYATIGMTNLGLIVVVSHTDRGKRIRIISARKATSKEKREYEEGI